MSGSGFTVPIEDRYLDDYAVGSVHEFGAVAVEEGEVIAFALSHVASLGSPGIVRSFVEVLDGGREVVMTPSALTLFLRRPARPGPQPPRLR